ncbi:hypothetical protein [Jiulongibacter sp. NS-SX5]|uniref:hypothetical protein n=1 Tax=Jiulongibacter sp. NS-SX5 TaxID=3463854 RepID=UPI004058213A
MSPLHLFDLDNGFSLAYEVSNNGHDAFQIEAGYGHSNANLWLGMEDFLYLDEYRGFHIFRVRVEWKKYFKKENRIPPNGGYYAFDILGKYVFKNSSIDIGREPIARQPQYFEKVGGKIRKQVGGAHFKIGKQMPIGSGYEEVKLWYLDVFCGLGFRLIHNSISYENPRSDDQVNFYDLKSFGTVITQRDRVIPVISGTLGLKIGKRL